MRKWTVHVVGDPTVDWLNPDLDVDPGLGPYFYAPDRDPPKVGISSQAGGAALLTQFLKTLLPTAAVSGVMLDPRHLAQPNRSGVARAWSDWKRQEGPVTPIKQSAFRISRWGRYDTGNWNYGSVKLAGTPDLLVVDDSGLGFRGAAAHWPSALKAAATESSPADIIVKLALYGPERQPLPVLEALVANGLAQRTTIVTALSDLRACPVLVGSSLSWERLFEDTVAAVYSAACPFSDPGDRSRLRFKQVIVTANGGGAVIVHPDENTLIFDRSGQEGDFETRFKGSILGTNTAVLGALAAEYTSANGSIDWRRATRRGIALARTLLYGGYEEHRGRLRFPASQLRDALQSAEAQEHEAKSGGVWDLGQFVDKRHRARQQGSSDWTILEEGFRNEAAPGGMSDASLRRRVEECGREIVKLGPGQIAHAPVETVGKWRSADRHEIEGVRSVKNAITEYLAQGNPSTPLAIAVFGPPGAGKSFAIKEIAKGFEQFTDAVVTFNLSQFETPEDLIRPFHDLRDLHLNGKTPLVFWDEFDTPCQSRPLGWLRYFLAPIQDGVFVDRGAIHPTGGGVFVFAGGTCRTFREFCAGDTEADRAAKKPDFTSRLRAYIDIKGPNGDPNAIEDNLLMIRRAFLLNSFLERHAAQLKRKGEFVVGDGILSGFLRTAAYRHGARSMETIVRMSSLRGKHAYELSSLPPPHLLSMHVDAADFLSVTKADYRGVLRIGVTGHIGLDPTKSAALHAGIQQAVDRIEAQFPGYVLTVCSSLALGADRLVVREVLARQGTRLFVVLPVPSDEYVNDFGPTDEHHVDYAGAEVRQEFRYLIANRAIETITMPASATRDEAYEKAGRYISDHCDVVVAVWDGAPAQGRGGTAEIVAHAAASGKPLVHVWAGNYKARPENRTDVGDAHGKVRYCWKPTATDVKALVWQGECVAAEARPWREGA
jgi:hypothetical protein